MENYTFFDVYEIIFPVNSINMPKFVQELCNKLAIYTISDKFQNKNTVYIVQNIKENASSLM